jgi:hypothetical protein|uniref:Uncharacterized protein n=1 Tax=Zea mays TaxID=4577 RepID=D1ME32_MAIZE|nr:unknown [Zea mays]
MDEFPGWKREAAAASGAGAPVADDAAPAGAVGVGLLAHVRRVPELARWGHQGLRIHEHGRAPPQHLVGGGDTQRHSCGPCRAGAVRPVPGLAHPPLHAQPEDRRRGLA